MSQPHLVHAARVDVDLDAIRRNVTRLREVAGRAEVLAVVKADAYGHGLVPVARAALAGGASWLGVAQPAEALALRAAGVDAPVLAWLFTPGAALAEAVGAGIDLSAGAGWALDELEHAARQSGRTARVHLKIDTGLGRGGSAPDEWAALVESALTRPGLDVVGVWSHLAAADEPGHSSIAAQRDAFEHALAVAEGLGLRPRWRHLANSAALLSDRETHYDLVRPGLAVYGLSPSSALGSPGQLGLTPALTLSAPLAGVKHVPAGQGVSYGHTHVTAEPTWLGLVPLGYGDGIPRHASSVGEVSVAGRRVPVVGRVCMDQLVVDLGPVGAEIGDVATVLGPGADGEPTAQDWAEAAGTISYEIVTRLGARVPRHYRAAAGLGARGGDE